MCPCLSFTANMRQYLSQLLSAFFRNVVVLLIRTKSLSILSHKRHIFSFAVRKYGPYEGKFTEQTLDFCYLTLLCHCISVRVRSFYNKITLRKNIAM